jgi:hypothetical protein
MAIMVGTPAMKLSHSSFPDERPALAQRVRLLNGSACHPGVVMTTLPPPRKARLTFPPPQPHIDSVQTQRNVQEKPDAAGTTSGDQKTVALISLSREGRI